MSTITDAVFFFKDGQIIQEMMKSEFDALVDGVVDAPDYKGRKLAAVYLQITDALKIRGLLFFIVGFDKQGRVSSDWDVPINQLMQSAERGMDLGAGVIRLVTKAKCNVPWHKENLWDPPQQVFPMLAQAVKENRLGIVESDEAWELGSWDIPTLESEPPILTASDIPTLTTMIPTLQPAAVESSFFEMPAEVLAPPAAAAPPAANPQVEAQLKQQIEQLQQETQQQQQELTALRSAFSVRMDKLQKERDELHEKNKTISETLKQQAKQQIAALTQDFKHDLDNKERQVHALKEQLQSEQQRYTDLKEQQAEQAIQYQLAREEIAEQLQQDSEAVKQVEALKLAFEQELAAKVEAQTTQVNARLAMREVELFYREEQMALLRAEIKQLKNSKQALLNGKDGEVLQALENQEVTLVVFEPGVGHLTLAYDDIGRFIGDKQDYLAGRCGVSLEHFARWKQHYQQPLCQHIEKGQVCAKVLKRVDAVGQFIAGVSDRCPQHQKS